MSIHSLLVTTVRQQLALRNELSAEYISQHSAALTATCQEMAKRFLRGGRLLAFGRGACLSDAQHITVEFIHPIMVGKRALPAIDLSALPAPWLATIVRPDDIVMGFCPPNGDEVVHGALETAVQRGALVCEWPGRLGAHELPAAAADPFLQQELTEVMYHTLWETVHVFLDQEAQGDDLGAAAFLYPSLARGQQAPGDVAADVQASIVRKAADDELLRTKVGEEFADLLAEAAVAMDQRLRRCGTLITLGNGGSATDANDLAIDCVAPPAGMRPIPALSLAMDPANLSAIGNDVGIELVFLRQLIAHSRPGDVVAAISTSGTSANIAAALLEARKRGIMTLALVGGDGGDIVREKLADFTIVVRSDYTPRIQEVQASVYHVLRLLWAQLDSLPR